MQKITDHTELAGQLECPSGTRGLQIADNMFNTNRNLIRETVELLDIQPCDHILEIGFGNARHLNELFKQHPLISYTGADISELMVHRAIALNTSLMEENSIVFRKTDGTQLPFPAASFDRVFTVNTLYFWKNPQQQLGEIGRVLAKNGRLCIAIVAGNSMEKLPFVRENFRLYSCTELTALLESAGFSVRISYQGRETVKSHLEKHISRDYCIVQAEKTGSR
ncbi:methyltransferase domain-containing protein [Sinomicrobium kalidii]|uniref:class I SAM-dependent methyltransferase n=1 Tax=Sinomicrobium kalidii TaxID=2900738 RepID=UPI001E3DC8AD|nr:class I SAM-dependent methyltransferase [Sinomicrobium kalidii]UGU15310.1 methyltransferase domain-containing protein [Sinomicrobium kalidii]